MTWAVVALGAAIGAPLRYLVEIAFQARATRRGRSAMSQSSLPWALLTVNVVGSALAGVVAASSPIARAGILVGFCGALTTYSGFGAHLDLQWRTNRPWFWVTLVAMPLACVAAFVGAMLVVSAASG